MNRAGEGQTTREVKDSDDLSALSAKIRALDDLYAVVRRAYARYREALSLIGELDPPVLKECNVPAFESAGDPAPATTENHRTELLNACRTLLVARLDLWSARTADDLKSWGGESQIEEQLTVIRKIALAQETIGQSFVATHPAESSHRMRLFSLVRREAFTNPDLTAAEYATWAIQTDEFVEWGDAAIMVIGIIVALLTAMSSLYVGKPFGTPTDFATAFAWGFGVDQGVKGIVAVLGKLGVSTPSATSISV